MQHKFPTINLAGRHLNLTATVQAAEPNVGIFGPWLEDLIITDALTGQLVSLSEPEEYHLEALALATIT